MYWKTWYGRQSDTLIVVEADTLDGAMREAREIDWRYDAAQPMTDEEVREAFTGWNDERELGFEVSELGFEVSE